MSAHDGLPRHKFGDVEFPSEVTRLRMVVRHHVHEYPHSPGGAPEKLGRGLIMVTCRANFQATFPGYPYLYPDGMLKMFGYASQGATLDFRHPTMGTWPAFIINWNQEKEAKIRSGEKVDIDFLEDQSASYALAALSTAQHVTAMGPTAAQLASDLKAAQADLGVTPEQLSVFDALQTAVNGVLSVKDTVELWGNRYGAELAKVQSLCGQIDQMVCMQDARAWPVVDSLQAVWVTAVRAQQDLHSQRAKLKKWTVPFTQPLAQIAMTLLGDASATGDLLSLNASILDPMNVQANTVIYYYPPTPRAA